MRVSSFIILLVLLLIPPVSAHHQDPRWFPIAPLPAINIYDPATHENERITRYSFEELDMLMVDPRFRQWNDIPEVCQSMEIMYGRVSARCLASVPLEFPRAVTERAYVRFEILPAPAQRIILLIDPAYPPFPPANRW